MDALGNEGWIDHQFCNLRELFSYAIISYLETGLTFKNKIRLQDLQSQFDVSNLFLLSLSL